MTALPMASAGRFSPLRPRGMASLRKISRVLNNLFNETSQFMVTAHSADRTTVYVMSLDSVDAHGGFLDAESPAEQIRKIRIGLVHAAKPNA
jgi:hypothetical protein